MEILKSNDYSLFGSINGNRKVNLSKVAKISEDVIAGFNMLPYCPVIVSKTDTGFNVIDGQHRLEVSKNTKNPVYYVVCEDLSLRQIAQLNSRGQKWTVNDFLNCYCNLGAKDYITLKEVSTEFRFPVSTCASLLMFDNVKSKAKEEFENGLFEVNHLESTKDVLNMTNELFSMYRFSKDRSLVGAVRRIIQAGKCDFEVLKTKINSAPNLMDRQGDVKNYIYNIERVYNHKNQTRKVII
jgi:hypothetical protein